MTGCTPQAEPRVHMIMCCGQFTGCIAGSAPLLLNTHQLSDGAGNGASQQVAVQVHAPANRGRDMWRQTWANQDPRPHQHHGPHDVSSLILRQQVVSWVHHYAECTVIFYSNVIKMLTEQRQTRCVVGSLRGGGEHHTRLFAAASSGKCKLCSHAPVVNPVPNCAGDGASQLVAMQV